jgi:hypothetical protein
VTGAAYVVLRSEDGVTWELVGEVARRPGVAARRSRSDAAEEALGRSPRAGEQVVVLPRSEWRNALDH